MFIFFGLNLRWVSVALFLEAGYGSLFEVAVVGRGTLPGINTMIVARCICSTSTRRTHILLTFWFIKNQREREAEEKMYPQVFKNTRNSAPVILGQRKNTLYYWRHSCRGIRKLSYTIYTGLNTELMTGCINRFPT